MQQLQADTAATVLIGAFVDKGDGVTPEEGITLAAADSAEIMKHDGTVFVDIAGEGANQCTLTHKEKGMYTLVIPAAVLDTEGRLTVFISDESICLPVWKDFMVISQAAWASLCTPKASGYMDVANIDVGLKGAGDDALTRIQAVIDDLSNATDGLGALKALITAEAIADAVWLAETDGHCDVAGSLAEMVYKAYVEGYTARLVTDKLDDTLEDDLGTYRFTENALEEAPSGTGGDATAANQAILIKILTNKWEITGNQLIIYDDDDETALYTFDLKNAAGAAASTRIFARQPVV